jgi:hypothetical protein
MTDTESQALLAIAVRQETQSLKQAQMAARKRLRAEAKAKRRQHAAELKEERARVRAAAEERTRRFKSEMRQVTSDFKLAVLKSKADIERQFEQSRQAKLENGILGQAIARRDLGLGLN